MDMSTQYLGLSLKNPLVPSASPLSRNLDSARKLEDAGASALVMYSLFEEEIVQDETLFTSFLDQHIGHSEASSYLPGKISEYCYLDHYLGQLDQLKNALDIPVIASLNATTSGGWLEHALELEQSGADALELNVYYIAANIEESSHSVEQRYIDLIIELKQKISIPITLKLSSQFSSPANMIKQLEQAGADGVSLFNRFYQPSIDLESLDVCSELNFSTSADSLLSMRWIAILYGRVSLSLAATGGIHNSDDALRLLLAGADVVQMTAALLEKGPEYLSQVLQGIELWMEQNEHQSISQLRGSVSQKNAQDPASYERTNYVKLLKEN